MVSVEEDVTASWTPATKLREILTEEEIEHLFAEEVNDDQGPSAAQMLEFTAQELNMTMNGLIGMAMASSMDMTEKQALRMNERWLPYLSVANCTAIPAVGQMWEDDWRTKER